MIEFLYWVCAKHGLCSNNYIYCLPLDLEGMPPSLLEAMSYENCCLVSDIAECTEVVEDKTVVFRKADVADLTEKLQTLCDRADVVDRYKAESRPYIIGKYGWDGVVDRPLGVYQG